MTDQGIERPFAIQELTLPLALAGEDVIGQARTGMGKTLAFGVPLLQRITTEAGLSGNPRALVVVPPANCACRSPTTWPPRPST
ncbi:DEAD/DEAH box helicase family protein [Mycobacterium xenopi 3993]|nr:DEAD/DEAH box helicase family protein [Mycobacterium xenopi 3993]